MNQINDMRLALLSPHRDDAAFSCGLFLTHLLRAGAAVHVVNICTQTDYAPYLAQTQQDRTAEVSAARHAEDLAFLQALQAASAPCTMVDLDWHDGPLRLAIETEAVLHHPRTAAEEVQQLAAALAPWAGFDAVLAPLGLGNHIDHRLVREAACQAIAPGRLGFYQDLPYVCGMVPEERRDMAAAMLRQIGKGTCVDWRTPADPAAARALKHRYAGCYPTQIAPDLVDCIADDAAAHDGSECLHLPPPLAERVAALLHGAPL